MGSVIGFVAAAGIVVSMLAIAAIAVSFVVAVRATLKANRADLALRADLDRVLADVLSPHERANGPISPR